MKVETELAATTEMSGCQYQTLNTLGISPSYQSDLTDCSFYPPTLARSRLELSHWSSDIQILSSHWSSDIQILSSHWWTVDT